MTSTAAVDHRPVAQTGPRRRLAVRGRYGWSPSWTAVHLATLVAAYVAEWWLLRGVWFRFDDFEFLAKRVGPKPVLDLWFPHNEHWSTGPILVWRLLYHLFGMSSAAPYFAFSLLAHVLTAHLLWRLALRCGVSEMVATGLAASFAVLGAGWENITWAFQVGFMGSSALGLGVVLLCLRDSRASHVAAILLAVCSLTFSGVGLTFVLAGGFTLALRRHRLRAVTLLGVCGGLYVAWYLLAGHLGERPEHSKSLPARAADAADWAWSVVASAAAEYTSITAAGGALAVALVVFLALHARAESGVLRLPTAAPRRERFVVLCALTSTALLQVASFAVNRSDISPADSPRYLYFVVGLLLPAVGVALTAAIGRVGQLTVAALLVYLVVTQGLVLVAAERPLEQSSMRGDVRGIAHLIVRGEPVAPVALAQDVDVAAITKWLDEGALGDVSGIPESQLRDARALAQVVTGPVQPDGTVGAKVTVPVAPAQLSAGQCAHVPSRVGEVAATATLHPGETFGVTLNSPAALVYRVVDGSGASRNIGSVVPLRDTRWFTVTVPLTVEVVADSGQDLTICVP